MSLLRELRIDDREAESYAHVHKFREWSLLIGGLNFMIAFEGGGGVPTW